MKMVLKITVAILIAGTVMVGGCVALIGGAASEASKEMDKQQNAHAITKKQLKSVYMGERKSDVIRTLGEPEDKQHMEQSSEFGDSTDDCLYYNVKGGEFMDSYQLCFSDGKLHSKNQY